MEEQTAYEETISIPRDEVERWDHLMSLDFVDLSGEGLGEAECVFFASVKFKNGVLADLKVCTSYGEHAGHLWSELVAYDERGFELWHSEPSDGLLGPWEFELKHTMLKRPIQYRVNVVTADISAYNDLGVSRSDLVDNIETVLKSGMADDYVGAMAELVADEVASDMAASSDPKKWGLCDVKLGVSRAIMKALGQGV